MLPKNCSTKTDEVCSTARTTVKRDKVLAMAALCVKMSIVTIRCRTDSETISVASWVLNLSLTWTYTDFWYDNARDATLSIPSGYRFKASVCMSSYRR